MNFELKKKNIYFIITFSLLSLMMISNFLMGYFFVNYFSFIISRIKKNIMKKIFKKNFS